MPDNRTLHFITVSYAPDVDRCRRLCESLDKYRNTSHCRHTIICPQRDLKLFDSLTGSHRKIMSYQQVLPKGYNQMPLFSKWWLDPGFFPVRGWIMQQLVKIAAASHSDEEYVIFADSDLVFCRSITAECFEENGAIRLLAKSLQPQDKDHSLWQRLSERLLWLTPQREFPNYVGQLMSWSPDVVRAMLARIENNADKPWYKTLGRLLTFSEYTLYGNFAEHIYQGGVQHFLDDSPISLDLWSRDDVVRLKDQQLDLNQKMIAVLIQSNLRLNQREEGIALQHALHMLQQRIKD
ncbi:MAG TPA: DUF6492 family protein [Pseudomonadales bacterium]|nr:DUF6492 family protein [Pseudomonadales bacterium]